MVYAHADEILGAGFLIKLHQTIGVEPIALPGRNDILEAELAGMPIMLQVVFVLRAAFDVHTAGIPIPILGSRLRPPMRPDSELGVAEPFRHAVGRERFARSREWTFGDLESGWRVGAKAGKGRSRNQAKRISSG